KPRFAIPFASNNCFLHRDTLQFNQFAVSPLDVKRHFDRHQPQGSECVVMVPGDSWNDQTGFSIQPQTFFTQKEDHLRQYARDTAAILDECYRRESNARVTFTSFSNYFTGFMNSLPPGMSALFKPVIVFQPEERPNDHWVLDFRNRRIYESASEPTDFDVKFRVPAAVFRDCLQRKMFTLLFPSKRLRIVLKKGRVKDYFMFEQLFDLYEYGLLPLKNSLSLRSLRVWLRR